MQNEKETVYADGTALVLCPVYSISRQNVPMRLRLQYTDVSKQRHYDTLTIEAIRESPIVSDWHPGGATYTHAGLECSIFKHSIRRISLSHGCANEHVVLM